MVENAHYRLEGLVCTLCSDLMEKTDVNVNVKSLLVPWLARHCAWCLTKFAIGADGQTTFKRQRGKDYAGETACFGEGICYRIPFRIQTKMEPRWEADGERHRDNTIVSTKNRQIRHLACCVVTERKLTTRYQSHLPERHRKSRQLDARKRRIQRCHNIAAALIVKDLGRRASTS